MNALGAEKNNLSSPFSLTPDGPLDIRGVHFQCFFCLKNKERPFVRFSSNLHKSFFGGLICSLLKRRSFGQKMKSAPLGLAGCQE